MGMTARLLRVFFTALLAAPLAISAPVSAQSDPCVATDLTGDGRVDARDLATLLGAWGACPANACGADLNGDGVVNGVDLATVFARWGDCAPAIATVTPASGTPKGGTIVTITGTSFQSTSAVEIGGVPVSSFTVLSGTTLTAVTPPGTVGAKSVAVTTAGGTATKANAFTYAVPWYTVLEAEPDPAVVTNAALRSAIVATGYPWRVRDNGTQIEMMLVPPGTYTRGCSQGSDVYPLCWSIEQPTHTVTLTNPFYIGRYEVTQAQWQARMGSNPSFNQGQPDSPSRPVERVSFFMVQEFLAATGFRLPTEGEWEYAYRAGTTLPFHGAPGFPNGSTSDEYARQIAWFAAPSTRAVGGLAANGFGLHDMGGNVWEWCSDYYAPYTAAPLTNPTGPASGSNRVWRGGSYSNTSQSVRASWRNSDPPTSAYDFLGFRVARTP
jgi:formylglycine-generating enzyme required for sulfatase activity